jgi:hypothetical protein
MMLSSLILILAVAISRLEAAHSSTPPRKHSMLASFVVPSRSMSAVPTRRKPLPRRDGAGAPRPVVGRSGRGYGVRISASNSAMTLQSSGGGGSEGERSDVGGGIGDRGEGGGGGGGRYDDTFGPLLPIAEAVDAATGGWGLSYADLHPATPRTNVGRAFLATNFFYAAAGLWLMTSGDWLYGALTEVAGVVSFVYHYTQLEFGRDRSEVRLALLIDYACAGAALITGGAYMVQAGMTHLPPEAYLSAAGAVLCLSLCWVWEFGYPFIFWHSLWHLLSAYTGYVVGVEHLSNIAG